MSLGRLLDTIKGKRALIVGDLMLDEYILGRATRISPEAPVMVVRQESTMAMPGGAANVAKNVIALGGGATIVGIVGRDAGAETLKRALADQGIDHTALVQDSTRPTTRKTRVLADHAHQVLRIDHEDESPLAKEAEAELTDRALDLLASHDVVILSDYLKGALTPEISRRLIERAQLAGKGTVVNPKPRSLAQYAGASIVSLNRAEAAQALERWGGLSDEDALAGAEALRNRIGAGRVVVTLGESGMVSAGDPPVVAPAPRVEVYDTAGAGDTVIATIALGSAAAAPMEQVLALAAEAAAAVVRKVGVATPSPDDLATIARR